MPGTLKAPTICLNMIVRDEAHIVSEVLDATAPYIDYLSLIHISEPTRPY